MLGRLIRKVALKFAEGEAGAGDGRRATTLPRCWDRSRFSPEQARKELPAGVATGLAWTETGGDVLYIEGDAAARRQGADHHRPARRGDAGIGQDGAQLLWSHAAEFGIDPSYVPERAVCTSTFRRARSRRTVRRRA